MTREYDSALKLPEMPDPVRKISGSWSRAKALTGSPVRQKDGRKIAPQRLRGLEAASRLWGHACQKAGVSWEQVASTLGIHSRVVGAYADPTMPNNIAVGDVLTLALSGRSVGWIYLQDAIAFAESHARTLNMSDADHLRAIVSAIGRLAMSTDTSDRGEYIRCLCELREQIAEAIRDAAGAP